MLGFKLMFLNFRFTRGIIRNIHKSCQTANAGMDLQYFRLHSIILI